MKLLTGLALILLLVHSFSSNASTLASLKSFSCIDQDGVRVQVRIVTSATGVSETEFNLDDVSIRVDAARVTKRLNSDGTFSLIVKDSIVGEQVYTCTL